MEMDKLIAIVTILITLSVATERLVEIVRGVWAWVLSFFKKPKPAADGAADGAAVTVVAEPVVEIPSVEEEMWKKARISLLAIVCGIFTSWLAKPVLVNIFKGLFPEDSVCGINTVFKKASEMPEKCDFSLDANGWFIIIALGLLASGGSALWNSILGYLLKLKDLKGANVVTAKTQAANQVNAVNSINNTSSLKITNLSDSMFTKEKK